MQRSPSIRLDISFADAIIGSPMMAVSESRFGNVANRVVEGEDVTFSDMHAKMVATVSVPKMSQFNEAKDFSRDGEKAASLSSSDAFVSNNELWSEIVGLAD